MYQLKKGRVIITLLIQKDISELSPKYDGNKTLFLSKMIAGTLFFNITLG